MPVSNKKHITPPQVSTGPSQPLPDQREFYQRLKEQTRVGLRALLEGVMQEELQALLGAGWGEHTPERKGYRNGYYTRDLGTNPGCHRGFAGAPRPGGPIP